MRKWLNVFFALVMTVMCGTALVLPAYAAEDMRQAIRIFDKKLRGFADPEAVLTGVETRSSSPVRITRNEKCCSLNLNGLYPAGEGAGYSGGIVSSAVDGIKCAFSIINRSKSNQ